MNISKSVAIACMLASIGCGANSDLVRKNEEQRNQIAQQKERLQVQELENRKLLKEILKLPVKEPATVAQTEAAPVPATTAAPTPVAQAAAPVRLPATVPAILPGPNDVGRVPLIGYADPNMDPCGANAVERSLMAYASPIGYPMSVQPFSRKLPGECAALRRSNYAMHVRVGALEMSAYYRGGQVTSTWSEKGADRRLRPLVMPGHLVLFHMPRGTHTVAIDLYAPAVVGNSWEFVKTVCWTNTWPSTYGPDPWGYKQDAPEHLPECRL